MRQLIFQFVLVGESRLTFSKQWGLLDALVICINSEWARAPRREGREAVSRVAVGGHFHNLMA